MINKSYKHKKTGKEYEVFAPECETEDVASWEANMKHFIFYTDGVQYFFRTVEDFNNKFKEITR